MLASCDRLRCDTDGNVAFPFAIALIPIVGMVGGTIASGVTDGQNIFDAQIANKKQGLWNNLSRTVTVMRSSGQVISTVQFSADVPSAFM